jgi:3-hydroxyisobutyrate dehydrogenase/putative dehydrogenase
MSALRVGWVGLGAMGAPMAACAARAGFDVVAYDVDGERRAALTREGAAAATSAAEAAKGADVLAVMVATPEQVEDVLFGAAAAADALRPGAVVLVMATVGPDAAADCAARLSERGVDLVDAPVSGGVARAATGDLLVLAAGNAAVLSRVRPLLDALAATVSVVGDDVGAGQKVKLVNQLLAGVHIAAAAEALAFAGAMGLDERACWEAVRHGAAASFMLDDRGARMLDASFDDVRSALDIFVKDMGLVADAARDAGAAVPLAAQAHELYQRGHRAGLGRLDDSSVIQVLREPQ